MDRGLFADHCRVPMQWFNLFSQFLRILFCPLSPLLMLAHSFVSVTEFERKKIPVGLDSNIVPVDSHLTLTVMTVAEIAEQLSVYIIPRTVLAKS